MLLDRRLFPALLAVLFLGGLVPEVQAREKLALQLPWHHQFQFAGYYMALEKGFYKDAGLDVEIRDVAHGPNPVAEVLESRAQFGVSGSGLLVERSLGKPVVALAAIIQNSPAVFLALEESGIRTLADFAGKRIMVSPGYNSLSLLAFLRQEKLLDKVQIIPTSFDYHSLVLGETDLFNAYLSNEPYLLQTEGHSTVVFDPNDYGISFYKDILFTSEAYLNGHFKEVEKFRKASIKGWEYALAHQTEAITLIKTRYQVDKTIPQLEFEAKALAPLIQSEGREIGRMEVLRWGQIGQQLIALDQIDPRYAMEDAFIYSPPVGISWHRLMPYVFIASSIILVLSVFSSLLLAANRRNRKGRLRLEQEIAEHRRTYRELRDNEQKYRILLNGQNDAVLVHPLQEEGFSKFVEVNDHALSLYGYTREEIVDLDVRDITAGAHDLKDFGKFQRQAIMEKGKILFSNQHKKKSGEVFDAEVNASLLEWQGRPHIMSVVRDISERIRMQEKQDQLEKQMLHAQKLESMGVLAGGIAHDFNNILLMILGHTDLATMALPGDSPAHENLQQVKQAAVQAADLANQMLAYSGKGRFIIEPVDLTQLIQEMEYMLAVSVDKKAVLSYHFSSPLPSVEADATQMRQVIMNLIINASEAIGGQSGHLTVSTGMMDCDADYLREPWLDDDLEPGHYVYLEVADTGCGIAPGELGKVFDPFYSTKFTGRGLGMSAVLGIVRGHRGAIKVKSTVGKGTSFQVLLPASGKIAAASEQAEARGELAGSGIVLLANDEPGILDLGKAMLGTFGFEVLTAENGELAVEKFRAHKDEIQFCLLDLTMPQLDGQEAAEAIREIDPTARIILCSGFNKGKTGKEQPRVKVDAFLKKPYRVVDLENVIRELAL
jgi:two-component system cell cycle sensor histidine kinase/response regulator CckA